MSIENEIDIYVVSYNHEDFICRNVTLSERQNPDTKINWYIGVTGDFESFSSIRDDPSVQIISDIIFPKDNQHMRCMLHLLSRYGSSRYRLILDPDFFLIQDNWVSRCIAEIQEKALGCIATQWHPTWRKQRWGLAPHFLFYDTSRIAINRKDVFPTRSYRAIYNVNSGMLHFWLKSIESVLGYVQRLDQIITGGQVMRVSDTCAGLSWRLIKDNIRVLRLAIHFKSNGISEAKDTEINQTYTANKLGDYIKKKVTGLIIDSPYSSHYWNAEIEAVLIRFPGNPELHYLGHRPFGIHARKYGRSGFSASADDLHEFVCIMAKCVKG
jgi:hypothetical protein